LWGRRLVKGCSVPTAALLTIAVGGLIGVLNGLAIGGLRMMPFIVTLGMMEGVGRGTAKWLSTVKPSIRQNRPINQHHELKAPDHLFPLAIGRLDCPGPRLAI